MEDIEFTVRIHFANGFSLERQVPLSKAVKLSMKDNVIIDVDTDLYEEKGLNNTIVIPLSMTFVINKAPALKNQNAVSRYMVYKRDKGRCAYCGKELSRTEATIDHILPKSRGGKTTWENVVLSCKKCNCDKDDMTPEEAGMKLLVKPYNPKKK